MHLAAILLNGLRDYGTAQWDGGDPACGHIAPASGPTQNKGNNGKNGTPFRDTCGKCGARRIDAQIGLEPSPEAWLATMVGVFREVRRVLRDDGTVWLNVGDSYSGGGGFSPNAPSNLAGSKQTTQRSREYKGRQPAQGYKPKDLLMMPARLALALQADGWWVRSDIIWAKPNPMPESCRDRPTSAHEHIFLLSKRARYFFDSEAVRETTGNEMSADEYAAAVAGYPGRSNDMQDFGGGRGRKGFLSATPPTGRNLRNVWTIATQAYSEAHFATFPAALAERCIRAGTSERGCCSQCGKPWTRVVEQTLSPSSSGLKGGTKGLALGGWEVPRGIANVTTTGWQPGCTCNAAVAPCVVLDPFSGAGTTALVADRLGRDAIGIDLSHAYVDMARARLEADCPLFADVSPPPAADPEDERMADLFAVAAE